MGVASANSASDSEISHLISTGQIEAARVVLENSAPSQTERLFFDGRVLKARGKFADALSAFRQTLHHDPDHINAQRELAHTLMLHGRYDAAERHFQALLSIDPNEYMRDGYRAFLKQINQNKPVRFSGHFSILPSTNINRGTTNTIFDTTLGRFVINPASQAESGVGIQLGLSGRFRYPIDNQNLVFFYLGLSGKIYKNELFNSSVNQLTVSYKRLSDLDAWSISPYFKINQRKDDADNNTKGLIFNFSRQLDFRHQISFSAEYGYNQFKYQNYKNGVFGVSSMNLNRNINPHLSISSGIGFEHNNPEANHLKYKSYKLFSELNKKWKDILKVKIRAELGWRKFSGLYPLTTVKRDDRFNVVSVGVESAKLKIQNFIPALHCSHIKNYSNIPFYEYKAIDCLISVSKSF